MSTEHKGADFFVGLFLLIGFGTIAIMVLIFGRADQAGKALYPLRVEFPNASGLIKGSEVFFSGARVGYLAAPPRVVDNNPVPCSSRSMKASDPADSTFRELPGCGDRPTWT